VERRSPHRRLNLNTPKTHSSIAKTTLLTLCGGIALLPAFESTALAQSTDGPSALSGVEATPPVPSEEAETSLPPEAPLPPDGAIVPSDASLGADEAEARVFRLILKDTSTASFERRLQEGSLGIIAGGALVGAGFVADGPNHSWAHSLWIGSGISALGGLAVLLIKSDVEKLYDDSAHLSEGELRQRFRAIAESAKVERRVGAVFSGLVGGAGIAVGALAIDRQFSELNEDQAKLVGGGLIVAGTSAAGEALFRWFVPTPIERGEKLAEESSLRVTASATPLPGGAAFQVAGSF
jgi:hypothetical protein